MSLAWADHLSVGNAMIDSDHRNLIELVNRIQCAIGKRDPIKLSRAMESFAAFMHVHLKNEEQLAEAVNFPLGQNRLEHQQLMYEIKCMLDNLDPEYSVWPDNVVEKYSRLLSDWMMDHIIQKGMQMKPMLQSLPYDFLPG